MNNKPQLFFKLFLLITLVLLVSCKTEAKWHTNIMTTMFYVGEQASEDNAFIANTMSAYDEKWLEHYGGVDFPERRNDYNPADFVPKENPFYFALPYSNESNKNKWISIRKKEKICYAQWEDVGPFETDDYEYVYEFKQPKNQFGMKAGLDVSPAVWNCLGMEDNDYVDWMFVDDSEVPNGPWKNIVTNSEVYYER